MSEMKIIIITDDVENCKNPVIVTIADLAVEETFTRVNGDSYETVGDPATVTRPACLTNGQKCTAGTPVAIEVAPNVKHKFYVLSDTGSEITLIMDRNLYSETDENNGNVAWYSDGDDTTNNETTTNGPLTALATLQTRTNSWTNLMKITINTFEDETGALKILGNSFTMHARLPKYSELYSLQEVNGGTLPSYLIGNISNTGDSNTDGYWTSTAYSETNPWDVYYYSTLDHSYASYNSTNLGLRPVITLSK